MIDHVKNNARFDIFQVLFPNNAFHLEKVSEFDIFKL